jgi:hypothetical protein
MASAGEFANLKLSRQLAAQRFNFREVPENFGCSYQSAISAS